VWSGHEMSTHYFLCSGGSGVVSTKSASGHVTPNLCFGIRSDCRSNSAFCCDQATQCRCSIFHARVGAVQTPQIVSWDMLCQNFVFPSSVNCGSRITFWCIQGVKYRRTIFHAQVTLVRFPQKGRPDTLR
jgi:hypothetical protein